MAIVRTVVVVVTAMLIGGCASGGSTRPATYPSRVVATTPPAPVESRRTARSKRSTQRPRPPQAVAAPRGQRECPASMRAAVVERVNTARRAAALRPLANDTGLGRAAESRAHAMAAANRLSHAGWERTVRDHDRAPMIGENVAYNYPSAAAVVDAWMRSPRHRANVLGREFRRIGVGCVVDAEARLWWAQDFAN